MTSLLNWLDHRTGIRGITRAALYEHIPGGARWRYVWGSTLMFTFMVQMVTGFFLWMAYSPSSQTAWESVYYIQNQLTGGWLLRGIHHYTAQVMIVLLALHMLQVVVDGAYRAPRELNFWIGLILLLTILILVLRFRIIPGGSDHLGAELSAPADPSEPFSAARPEWYFLFLFQFLKYFPGPALEFVGSVVI